MGLPTAPVEFDFEARCYSCGHFHPARPVGIDALGREHSRWDAKHPAPLHQTEFRVRSWKVPARLPRALESAWADSNAAPWWVNWRENADIKTAWLADAALTITLASLASSSTLLAGRESGSIDLNTDKPLDAFVSGKITTGTSPTDAKVIEVWASSPIEDTPTWGDVLDGTDSDESLTSDGIKFALMRSIVTINTNNTSDRVYPFAQRALSSVFGALPKTFVVWVTHNTGVNLNSTGGNHAIYWQGLYATAA